MMALRDKLKPNADGLVYISNFINGQFLSTASHLDSFDPSTGQVWARLPDSDSASIASAVSAAKSAFPTWSQTPAKARAHILTKIADLIESNLDLFAEIESRDQGKPVWLARSVDIPRCVLNFRFFAGVIQYETTDSTMLDEPKALNYVLREPIGVAGLISPWNLPLYLLSFKVAPAIACGNTVVAKPSELTSVSAYLLAHIFVEAGLPPGVVNLVFGTGPRAGEPLIIHPDVPLISFTGSTLTGRRIAALSAPFSKKLSLEMGGKNASIIFADADLSQCIPTSVRASFLNQGEICLCTSRIFVHSSIFEHFVEEFVAEAKTWTVGAPDDVRKPKLGALVSAEHLRKVQSYVELAKETPGARILCGGEELVMEERNAGGYFMRPTVVTGVDDASRLMQEEIFGPVVCIVPFDDDAEAIRRANDVKYGLCACVWTQNVAKLHWAARNLQAGTVWCNCWLVRDLNMPFGGTKASGIGREGAKHSIDFFTEEKTVCVKMEDF